MTAYLKAASKPDSDSNTHFHGSYLAEDVIFLMDQVVINNTDVIEKERLIQSGEKHYSEMLTKEQLPSDQYKALFEEACTQNLERMARDCLHLALTLQKRYPNGVTLVSLARAGTPIGVIVRGLLAAIFKSDPAHYSISIIRDKGIDTKAIRTILEKHADTSIAFIDGWTGKGVISTALQQSISAFNHANHTMIDSGLYVLADLAGSAKWAATTADYLIPSSILNATVSGLVSRSIFNPLDIENHHFHGCYFYQEFLEHDQSLSFKNRVIAAALNIYAQEYAQRYEQGYEQGYSYTHPHIYPQATPQITPSEMREISRRFMCDEMLRQNITNENLIKPSIGEATRVLLRRDAHLILVKDKKSINIQHILYLAHTKNIPVEERPSLPYEAVSIIKVRS